MNSRAPRMLTRMAAAALLSAGCAVGPNFTPPHAPTTPVYDSPESQVSAAAAAAAQSKPASAGDAVAPQVSVNIDSSATIPGEWWQLFKSDALDQTLKLAIADSPSLTSAQAALAAAREAVIVARAGYLPHVNAVAGGQRSGTAGLEKNSAYSGTSSNSTAYSLGLSASYSFNALGGATRRLVEQQQALAENQRYQLAGAYLTLTGSVVAQSLSIAAARLQIAVTLDLLASDQKNLALTQRMFDVGSAARTDVLTAESQLAADETTMPSLRQQLSVAQHALAALVGHTPADWAPPDFDLDQFKLPPQIPVSVPSTLVKQRPDILAAEAQLQAASAAVGVAVAQEYPSITLSGSLTRDALTAANLFHDFERLWNVGGTLTQPLFQGGALRAQVRAASDTFDAQAGSYQEVVLAAFEQVADDLRALEHDAHRVAAYRRALRIADDSLVLQRISYSAGKTTVLQLIDAERSYSQARLGYASAEVSQFEDAADLFVALGGGWWHTAVAPPG